MIEQTPEFSVSEISLEIKHFVENTFNKVRIRGEIFGAKRADSGHWYLSLKDENAVLSAVIWKGVALHLPIKPEDGLAIIATGKITTFPGKSSYQLVIEQMEVAGTGALLKLLEERKQKYLEEGLFDSSHKQQIPYLPNLIGVVTSPTGAVIRDIIHRISDRFPSHLLVWPTPVQGTGAEIKIAEAIRGFNNLPIKPDVIIVARGGGSLEDLWCFNEDAVIRAVYDSKIPIISAVGHETDTMLIDYVADKRAPTPTGAAEFAVPVRSELVLRINTIDNRLLHSIHRLLNELHDKIIGLNRGIPKLEQILLENQQRLDDRWERIKLSFSTLLQKKQSQIDTTNLRPYFILNILDKKQEYLNNLSLRLDSVSIDSVLKRGFAWVKDSRDNTVYTAEQAQKSSSLKITFADSSVKTKVIMKKNDIQGDLFDF